MSLASAAETTNSLHPRYFSAPSPISVEEALRRFAAPAGSAVKVQILRPFSVYSKTAYSSVMTLPVGPAYLASTLEEAGYQVDIIDAQGESLLDLRSAGNGRYKIQGLSTEKILDRIDPDAAALGISLMFSQEWPLHRELLREIHRAYPDLTIVAGGEHSTAMPDLLLESDVGIDYVVKGEGEIPFLELLHHLSMDDPHADIGGVVYLDSEGDYVDGGLSRRILDIDNLPWPAWHKCKVPAYFTGNWSSGIAHGRNMPILATRGCPYQCTFCSNPTMWTTRYVMRDPASVVDEIEHLIETYQANSFDFADLTAIVRTDWILSFCQELERRNLDLNWQLPSGTRSEALDEGALQALLRSGCSFLVFAPESGSQATLDQIRKRLKIDNIRATVGTAVAVGHTVKVNFIIGFPDERRGSILKTLWEIARMAFSGAHDCNVAVFTPYPGSELYRELRDNGQIPEPDDAYFLDLLVQFDFTVIKSHCQAVPDWELAFYRFISMASFYALAYLLHPGRIWKALCGIIGGEFQAKTLFEQRVHDFVVRTRMSRKGRGRS